MSGRLKVVLAYAVLAAIWVALFDRWIGPEKAGDAALQGWLNAGKTVVFVAISALLVYGALSIRRGQTEHIDVLPARQISRLIALFFGLSLIAPLLGYGIYRAYLPEVRQKALADVDSVAAFKAEQIEDWLEQRYAHASVLARDPYLADAMSAWLSNKKIDLQRERIRGRLEALRQVYGYDVVLLDASGTALLQAGTHSDLSDDLKRRLLPQVLRTGQVQRSELFRDHHGVIHLDYLAPLKQSGKATEAVILLHTPIAQFLFPLIQRWPTPSPSGEMMLVQREGDQVLYLNELRHQRNTALSLRIPLNTPNAPSAIALRTGKASLMETRDREGNAVFAASRPITGTNWMVVAKINRDEVLASLRRLTLWSSLIALGAVAAIASAVWHLWHAQQRAHELALLAHSARSDELLKVFFDLPFLGMCITSPTTKRWLRVNARLCEILGYSRDELLQLTWAEVTYPEDLDKDIEQFERVLQGEIDGYQMDKRYLRKDGQMVEASIDVKTIRDKNGAVEWFLATVQDITERKRMEATLRENERHFKRVLDSVLAFAGILSPKGILEFANKTALDAGGLRAEEVVGKSLEETYWVAWSNEVQQRMRDAVQRAAAGETVRYDDVLRMAGGQLIDVEISIIAMRDEQGKVTHLIPSGVDITERKRAEKVLRESEARYRTLLETAPFPVVITRLADGILRYGNRRAEEKFGIPREQGVGEPAISFYVDAVEREIFLTRLLAETTVSDQEVRLRGADQKLFWAQISAAIIEYEGQPAIFSSINDISVLKQAEEHVRSLNTELEKRVAERTAQLETINKELESFAYSVSHDLKAPLRGIDGYSTLLLEDHAAQLDQEGLIFLNNIRAGAKHMAQLIEDLLAYSRLERRAFQVDEIDVQGLVDKILYERAADIAQRKVQITTQIGFGKLQADREGVALVMRNLIDNALKFTSRAVQPQIEIGMREQPGACILWVRDNGIGFDMNFHERIFEIFQRLQLAEDFPGTGIGLAIVRKAAQRMGGRIWAVSSPGQGASFFLELPA